MQTTQQVTGHLESVPITEDEKAIDKHGLPLTILQEIPASEGNEEPASRWRTQGCRLWPITSRGNGGKNG